jgi:hypothetical protein
MDRQLEVEAGLPVAAPGDRRRPDDPARGRLGLSGKFAAGITVSLAVAAVSLYK